METSNLIYLASPYTHKNKITEENRFNKACDVAARMMRYGMHVFSPIAHGHSVAKYGLPTEFDYWQAYCENTLLRCDMLMVLMIEGWSQSIGVTHEVALAKENGIPVYMWNPENHEWWEYGNATQH